MDHLLGVRVNVNGPSAPLELLNALHQIRDIRNIAFPEIAEYFGGLPVEVLRQKEPQRCRIPIPDVNADRFTDVGSFQLSSRKSALYLRDDVQDVLAGPERVRAKVRAGAVGLAGLQPSNGNAIPPECCSSRELGTMHRY